MKADGAGNPDEQARAHAGWINATTRRAKIRAGNMPLGMTCGTCNSWSGTAIDARCICPELKCITHTAAVCDKWTLPRRARTTPIRGARGASA